MFCRFKSVIIYDHGTEASAALQEGPNSCLEGGLGGLDPCAHCACISVEVSGFCGTGAAAALQEGAAAARLLLPPDHAATTQHALLAAALQAAVGSQVPVKHLGITTSSLVLSTHCKTLNGLELD